MREDELLTEMTENLKMTVSCTTAGCQIPTSFLTPVVSFSYRDGDTNIFCLDMEKVGTGVWNEIKSYVLTTRLKNAPKKCSKNRRTPNRKTDFISSYDKKAYLI